jgi:hypothetical protein
MFPAVRERILVSEFFRLTGNWKYGGLLIWRIANTATERAKRGIKFLPCLDGTKNQKSETRKQGFQLLLSGFSVASTPGFGNILGKTTLDITSMSRNR